MEEQFQRMSAKLCWHSCCVRRAARTMLGIASRCRRHSCSCSGTSSRQCWLSFQATPLPASPLWGELGVTGGAAAPRGTAKKASGRREPDPYSQPLDGCGEPQLAQQRGGSGGGAAHGREWGWDGAGS